MADEQKPRMKLGQSWELVRFALGLAAATLDEEGCNCHPEEPCALCMCREAIAHLDAFAKQPVLAEKDAALKAVQEEVAKWKRYAAGEQAGVVAELVWLDGENVGLRAYLSAAQEEIARLKANARTTTSVPIPPPQNYWKCFHCGETFVTEEEAASHFGPRDPNNPLHARLLSRSEKITV